MTRPLDIFAELSLLSDSGAEMAVKANGRVIELEMSAHAYGEGEECFLDPSHSKNHRHGLRCAHRGFGLDERSPMDSPH